MNQGDDVINIRILLNKYGKKFTNVLKRNSKSMKLVASGDTLRSIGYTVYNTRLKIYYDKSLAIQSDGIDKKYMPDSRLILQWMIDKNIRPIEKGDRKVGLAAGRSKFAKGGADSRNMKASAFAIAKAIGQKGTIKRFGYHGSNILDYLAYESKVGKEFTKELEERFEESISDLFTHNQN
jgi:ribosomal protein S17E